MWNDDPIMAETRKLRESYAAKHNHDLDAIYQDILMRQSKPTWPGVRHVKQQQSGRPAPSTK